MKTRYRARPAVTDRFNDFADVVDAGVGCGVHFEDVDMAAFHDRLAVNAGLADIERGPIGRSSPLVVQRARKNTRGCRLADAAHARQHVGLGDPAHFERVPKRPDHDVLSDQIIESLRPVFAGKDKVRRWRP